MIGAVTIPYPTDGGPAAPRPRVRTAWVSLGVGVLAALTGLPLGWLWAELAPRVPAIKTENGLAYAEAAPEQAVAADGWFVLLGGAAGVVLAALAWSLLRRHRGVAILIALTLGSLAAAYIAWLVGRAIGQAEFALVANAAVGTPVPAPLTLRATDLDRDSWWRPLLTGAAAAQPLAAAIVYTTLAAFSTRPGLRPDPYLSTVTAPPEPYHDGLTPDTDPWADRADPDPYGPPR
jgi:hypothetical protein